ncbi:DUF2501 domain-containing protein [Affinibrenneria salicis]|uniref:DUF2501 domain-containing protein n=1 Tax=Affinibrenneria salicis TaxID=2590031 RepID=A0A5J5FZ82_9GAMM|nr:DUF2501 domain-containing protein [Affinibrenneria salicis]KAA8999333.1 DUF2501 domain-containing protein [Affinibrenneria salicis]
MKNATRRKVWILGMALALATSSATAASWQDQLNSAASQLGQQESASGNGASSGGLSLSSLSGLLNGGDNAVSSNTMSNAAGILQYCVKNNIVNNNVASVKEQVLGKLGLNTQTEQAKQTDYQQGLAGLLNTGSGQQLNLKSLGDTQLGQKVKTKACDVVLKQGKNFIS